MHGQERFKVPIELDNEITNKLLLNIRLDLYLEHVEKISMFHIWNIISRGISGSVIRLLLGTETPCYRNSLTLEERR